MRYGRVIKTSQVICPVGDKTTAVRARTTEADASAPRVIVCLTPLVAGHSERYQKDFV